MAGIKKLNQLITKSFFKTFVPTFLIVLFILLMQFIWLYVDDLAGKGLSWLVIGQLMFYQMASIIPLALPLSILLASIMTFGNLGESYELVAAKAAGISVWRIFIPMLVTMFFIALFAFFVSNVLIPKAHLKKSALLYDIKQQKPTLLLSDGTFYNGIEGISIRIGHKDPVTQELQDIVIYDNRGQSNKSTVILAQRGEMKMSADSRYMFLILYNGARYEEMDDQQGYERTFPHTTLSFAKEQIVFDMYAFNLNRTDESLFKDNYQMLDVIKLNQVSDSLKLSSYKKGDALRNNLSSFFHFDDTLYKLRHIDSGLYRLSGFNKLPLSNKQRVLSDAINYARSAKGFVDMTVAEKAEIDKQAVNHDIYWHKKITLSVACIIMFFIGAPFGAIIRKGGFGMPVVISVLLYILFHFLSITGEKMAKGFTSSPFVGMWLSIYVLAPVGFFLTFQAANDSGLFDKSAWVRMANRVVHIFKK